MSLLRFPPLAHAMNGFLAGCNEVRKCALFGLRPVCVAAIVRLVETVARHLASVRGTLLLEGAELESLRVMATAFAQDFVPHIERVTVKVFFGTAAGGISGTSVEATWQKTLAESVKSLTDAVSA